MYVYMLGCFIDMQYIRAVVSTVSVTPTVPVLGSGLVWVMFAKQMDYIWPSVWIWKCSRWNNSYLHPEPCVWDSGHMLTPCLWLFIRTNLWRLNLIFITQTFNSNNQDFICFTIFHLFIRHKTWTCPHDCIYNNSNSKCIKIAMVTADLLQ